MSEPVGFLPAIEGSGLTALLSVPIIKPGWNNEQSPKVVANVLIRSRKVIFPDLFGQS